MLLQPEHRLGVQVVGGLVKQQQVRLLQEQLAEGNAAALTTGERRDVGVRWRAPQGIHGLLRLGVEVPRVGVVDLLLDPISVIRASKSASGSAISALMALKRSSLALISPAPSSTLPRTVFSSLSTGSCMRMPTL